MEKTYKKLSIHALMIIAIILLTAISLQAGFATTHNIDNTTTGGIKDTLATSNPGDTIELDEGTYTGNNNTNMTINKNITIQGKTKDKVILDAQGLSRIFTVNNNLNVTFINITFINALTTGNGGAIFNNNAGTAMTFINCTFINNTITNTSTSTGRGGAIYDNGLNLTVIDCSFNDNNARNGGAIFNNNNVMSTITNSIFTNNKALTNGGAIYNTGVNAAVRHCNFTFNTAAGSGEGAGGSAGAVYNTGANMTVTDSTFTNNTASNYVNYAGGGAIYSSGANLTVNDSIFTNNTAGGSGGAIYSSGANLTVNDSTFTNNTASNSTTYAGGGAIYSRGANLTVNDSIFTNNTSGGSGGAIYGDSTVYLSYCNFTGNTAEFWGGVIRVSDESTIFNCILSNNTSLTNINHSSQEGGGAIWNYGNLTVINSTFTGNKANFNGGAIYSYFGANTTVINSTFTGNKANFNGGAIYSYFGANITVINSTFTDNIALRNGGAIYNNGTMLVFGNAMGGNVANLGQMIYNNRTMGILNLTFIGNSTWIVKNGQNITLYATLTDDMGNTVTGQNISFYLDGVVYESLESIEGLVEIPYNASITGLIPVSGEYAGIGTFDIITYDGLLRIVILNITIDGPDTVNVGDNATITGKIVDQDGNPVANQTVDFFVDGEYIGSGITDENGIAKINYTFKKVGNTKITVTHVPSSRYSLDDPISASKNTRVNKIPSKITINVPKKVKVNETVTLESKLTDENGNPITDAIVDFYVDGEKVGSAKTDKNGIARLKYTFTKSGKPNVVAKFPGDDKYTTSNATTNQITVSKINTKMTMKKKGNKIIVTLTDEDGNPLANKKITLRDPKGRVLGIGITNKDGQVTFTYVGNDLYLKANFDGDNIYNGIDAKLELNQDNPKTNDNSAAGHATMKHAAMKKTGIPIIAVILVLLASLGLFIRKQN